MDTGGVDDEDEDEDPVAAEEASVDAQETENDDGQIAHDDAVVKSLRDVAIRDMRAQGIVMTAEENQMALKLFPVVLCYFTCTEIYTDYY